MNPRENVDRAEAGTGTKAAVAPRLTFDTVVELLTILDDSTMPTRIEFRDGPLRLKVERGLPGGGTAAPGVAAAVPEAVSAGVATAAADAGSSAAVLPEASPAASAAPDEASGRPVPAPIAGVFYQAPSPGAEPFVEVGQQIAEDDVIGIVEVMKLMNTVRAGVAGTVTAVCVADGELVEFGQTLVRVEPAEG